MEALHKIAEKIAHVSGLKNELELSFLTNSDFQRNISPIKTDHEEFKEVYDIFDFSSQVSYQQVPLARIQSLSQKQVTYLADCVKDHFSSAGDKEHLARFVLSNISGSSANERIEQILQYLPQPSPLRDSFLKKVLSDNPVNESQCKYVTSLFLSETLSSGTISTSRMISSQLIDSFKDKLDKDKKKEFFLWMTGVNKNPPDKIIDISHKMGVSFNKVVEQYPQLSYEERIKIHRDFLLGNNGILSAESPEEKIELKEFISKIFDSAISSDIDSRETIKKTALSLFEFSIPERRLHLLNNIIDTYVTRDSKLEPKEQGYEMVAVFLENSGSLACKMMQVLCEDTSLPDGLRKDNLQHENLALVESAKDFLRRNQLLEISQE